MRNIKNYEKIAKVMGQFDFVQTRSLMEHLDWHWNLGTDDVLYGVPEVSDLVDMAHSLLLRSLNSGSASSGGFEATYDKGMLSLKFVTEETVDSDSYDYEELGTVSSVGENHEV